MMLKWLFVTLEIAPSPDPVLFSSSASPAGLGCEQVRAAVTRARRGPHRDSGTRGRAPPVRADQGLWLSPGGSRRNAEERKARGVKCQTGRATATSPPLSDHGRPCSGVSLRGPPINASPGGGMANVHGTPPPEALQSRRPRGCQAQALRHSDQTGPAASCLPSWASSACCPRKRGAGCCRQPRPRGSSGALGTPHACRLLRMNPKRQAAPSCPRSGRVSASEGGS